MKISSLISLSFGTAALFLLGGCATTELQTTVKMTRSIFVEPVARSKRTLFVAMRNTSGNAVDLEAKVMEGLKKKGYRIVEDPQEARIVLMANILFVDNLEESNAARGAATAGTVGTVAGTYRSGNGLVAGLAGAALGGLVAKATEDEIYRMVVDIVVRERSDRKVLTVQKDFEGELEIDEKRRSGFLNGLAGPVRSTHTAGELKTEDRRQKEQHYATDYVEKRSRLFAEAIKMNLELAEALPVLEEKMARQIVGIF